VSAKDVPVIVKALPLIEISAVPTARLACTKPAPLVASKPAVPMSKAVFWRVVEMALGASPICDKRPETAAAWGAAAEVP